MKLREFNSYISENAQLDEAISFYGTVGMQQLRVDGAAGATVEVDTSKRIGSKRVTLMISADAEAAPLTAGSLLEALSGPLATMPNAPVSIHLRNADGMEARVMNDAMWGHVELRGTNDFICIDGGDDTSLLDTYAVSDEDLAAFDAIGEKMRELVKPDPHNGHVHYREDPELGAAAASAESTQPLENVLDRRARRQRAGIIIAIVTFAVAIPVGIFAASKGIDKDTVNGVVYLVALAISVAFAAIKKKLGIKGR